MCECGHPQDKHNEIAQWAPSGCYAIVGKRYPTDTTGKVCECTAFAEKAVVAA